MTDNSMDDGVATAQLKRFGKDRSEPRPRKREPGKSVSAKRLLRAALASGPPPAVMAASRGPGAQKHTLEMRRKRKITGSHIDRKNSLIKSRTRRAKK